MIRLYLLGRKGLKSLSGLNPKYISEISEVIIGQDSNVVNDYSLEISKLAQEYNLPYGFRNKTQESKNLDLKIAIGWRWLINDINNLIIFHDSLLPKYRGFNPLVTALNNGDTHIGATAIKARKNFDTGPIIRQKAVKIEYPIKIKKAIELMGDLYSNLLNEVIKDYLESGFNLREQDENLASYSLWRDEEDYTINWNNTSEQIQRFINAVGYPYKGAKTRYDSKWLRIFNTEIENDIKITNRTAGKVIFQTSNKVVIVCGKGLLSVSEFYDEDGEIIDFGQKFRLRFGS